MDINVNDIQYIVDPNLVLPQSGYEVIMPCFGGSAGAAQTEQMQAQQIRAFGDKLYGIALSILFNSGSSSLIVELASTVDGVAIESETITGTSEIKNVFLDWSASEMSLTEGNIYYIRCSKLEGLGFGGNPYLYGFTNETGLPGVSYHRDNNVWVSWGSQYDAGVSTYWRGNITASMSVETELPHDNIQVDEGLYLSTPTSGLTPGIFPENISIQESISVFFPIINIEDLALNYNRYWVGGSGNWNDPEHWAEESGGVGGFSIPTEDYDVYIDSQSGISGGTITITGGYNDSPCRSFVSTTGVSYTITGNAITCYGSLSLESGLTVSCGIWMKAPSGSWTVGANGATMEDWIDFGGNNLVATYTLTSDLIMVGDLYLDGATFDANDFDVTAFYFYMYNDVGYENTLWMGSGTWHAYGGGEWYMDIYGGTPVINAETSTLVLSGVWDNMYLEEGNGTTGFTYNNVWIDHTDTESYDYWIYGENTFNELKITSTNAQLKVSFEAGKTQTIAQLNIVSNPGKEITISSFGGEGSVSPSLQNSLASNDSSAGTVAWVNPTNASIENGVYATATSTGSTTTNYLIATSFGFSIPENSTINGVTARVKGNAVFSGGGAISARIHLVKGGQVSGGGSGNASISIGATAQWTGYFGSSSSVLSSSATADEVNSPNFGCAFKTAPSGTVTQYIDCFEMTIYYSVYGQQHTLTKTSGSITLDHVNIEQSNATGGATWNAINSVNGGYNTGWIFHSPVNNNPRRGPQILGSSSNIE
jgi:hypothetical protein